MPHMIAPRAGMGQPHRQLYLARPRRTNRSWPRRPWRGKAGWAEGTSSGGRRGRGRAAQLGRRQSTIAANFAEQEGQIVRLVKEACRSEGNGPIMAANVQT